jgi:hypothetical protein
MGIMKKGKTTISPVDLSSSDEAETSLIEVAWLIDKLRNSLLSN